MIAAGFSDLGGVIHELETSDNDLPTSRPLTHAPRAKQTDSEHLSMSSMSSIQESAHASDQALDGGEGETTTVATAPSLARASSLNYRMHKRGTRVIPKAPTTPPTSVSLSPPAQSPKSSNLDVGMSLVLAPSPTLVPPLSGPVATPMTGSTHGPVPTGPMSSWMDNVGKKLSSLQNGQTYVV